jgi:hypothetical protein
MSKCRQYPECCHVEFEDGTVVIVHIDPGDLRDGSEFVAKIIARQGIEREARELGEPAKKIKSVTPSMY